MKSTTAEMNVLAKLDKYLARCRKRPTCIRLYKRDVEAVKRSRRRHAEPLRTIEYLDFTHYKGIPITIFNEDSSNG